MKLSVIMATYNETLQDLTGAVESILTQTFSEFEFIIICDNPERIELVQWLDGFNKQDERIVLLINEKNMGLPLSLNRGIEIAQGEYIARMDADDISLPERFERQLEFIQREQADLIGSYFSLMNEHGEFIGYASPLVPNEKIRKLLTLGNIIHHPTVMMRTSTVKELGGYRNLQSAEDYDLWLLFLSANAHILLFNECVLRYRIRSDGISRSDRLKQLLILYYSNMLYEQRKQSGKDDYSEKNKNQFLAQNKYFNEKYRLKANEKIYQFENGITKLKKKNPMGVIDMGIAFVQEKWVRNDFFRLVKYKLSK